jgi:hypothetical protein
VPRLVEDLFGGANFQELPGAHDGNRTLTSGAALVIFSVLFLATTRGDFLRASKSFLLIGLIFLLFLGFRVYKGFKRHRLLRDGEVVIGRVLSQERSGEWRQSSKITYEFEDLMGGVTSDAAADITESLYEGMLVVVFYRAEDVREHVALCETFFGIAVEGEGSVLDS